MSELASLFKNKKVAFKAITGHINYNLHSNKENKENKVFIIPDFEDMYNFIDIDYSFIENNNKYFIYDIRHLANHICESNVSFLETLYSSSMHILDNNHMSEIIKRREDLCKINMKFLYYNCIGTYYNNKKNMLNIHNDNYDNNLKYSSYHAMEAYRILDFLERYKYFIQSNAEHPFLLAINYFEDKEKQELLNIKNGIYSLSQITSILDTKIKQTKTICEDFYLSYEEDKELMQWLNNKIKQMIKENI